MIPGAYFASTSARPGSSFLNATSTLFDGTDDWVDLGEPADITINLAANEITMAAWVYCTDLTAHRYVLAKARPFFPAVNWILALGSTGNVFGYFGDVAKTTGGLAGTVVINTWYHVALTVRNIAGTYTGNIWLNGVKQGSDLTALGTATDAGTTARIGAGRAGAAAALPYKGNIDEVTFWNVGFTAAELLELYNAGVPKNPTTHSRTATLIHWYRMGDGDTYPTVLDKVGVANGTCTNMTSGAVNFVATVP